MNASVRSANPRLWMRAGVTAAILLLPRGASAQRESINLDRYQASETATDDFALSRPNDLGHLEWDGVLHIDYAFNPLVWEADLGDADTESSSIVEHQIVTQFGIAFGIVDRLVLFGAIPFTVVLEGDNNIRLLPEVGGSGIGDPRFGARFRLLGEKEDSFALALQAAATFPAGQDIDDETFGAGSETWSIQPEVLAEIRGGWGRLVVNAGARIADETVFGTLDVGNEMTFGIGAGIPISEVVTGHLQAYGSTDLDHAFDREHTPFEAILGAKLDAGEGWHAGAALGTGLTRGYGSPDLRVVLMLGHTSDFERAAEPEPEPVDTDGDGMNDDVDGCPTEPEDVDQFEDENGCPDPDNDEDQVLDANDGAPNDPEDRDEFQDEDGVPDPDNDNDGIADGSDRCPTEAEDMDQIVDEDGCPETDADSDTVLDPSDKCPMTPGLAQHQNPDCIGCPALACTVEGAIQILQRVEFETDSDRLLPESDPVLQSVLEILSTNNQIRKLRVEGHTDDRGNDEHNMDLSRRRAQSVRQWLVQHGIAEGRLEAEGFGESRPIVPNVNARNRRTNRRVEFKIIDPAPPADAAPGTVPAADPAPAGGNP